MAIQYYDKDGNAIVRSGGGGWIVTVILCVGFILMIAMMIATFIGYNPFRAAEGAVQVQTLPTARPQAAPAPAYQPPPVIVQSVPAGEAPQPVRVAPQAVPAAAPAVEGQPAPAPAPAPRPIVIVHQVSQDGARQTITGSGACAVAAVGARRCGK